MPKRLLPRHFHELGKRGQILLVFGILWMWLGLGVLLYPDPPQYSAIPMISDVPDAVRGYAWMISGGVAVAYAWRPRRFDHDGLAFAALYIMPAYRVVAFSLAWLDYVMPWFGFGYSRGLLAALPYAALVGAVMICASWAEPPTEPNVRNV